MSVLTLILIVLVVMMLTSMPPVTGHSYGWYPSSTLGIVLVLLLILLLMGRI